MQKLLVKACQGIMSFGPNLRATPTTRGWELLGKVKVVDTVEAGDTFVATVFATLYRAQDAIENGLGRLHYQSLT